MSEKRMFSKSIVMSDKFLDLPESARCLYYTFGMLADDDGFIGNPKSIIRLCGAAADDLKILIDQDFLISFDSGIIAIRHWRVNNYLRNDRYQKTTYHDELASLTVTENGTYESRNSSGNPLGIPDGNPDKNRVEESREEKSSIEIRAEEEREEESSPVVPPPSPQGEAPLRFSATQLVFDRLEGRDPSLLQAALDWVDYKEEKRQAYKPTGLKNLLTQIENNANLYGDAAVADLIRDSMSCNYMGVVFDRLKRTKGGRIAEQLRSSYELLNRWACNE